MVKSKSKSNLNCFKVKLKKFIFILFTRKRLQLLQKYSIVISSLSMLSMFNVLINPSEASMSPSISSSASSSAAVSSAEDTSSSLNGDTGSPFTSYLNSPPSKKERQLTPAELLADVDRVFPSNYDSLQTPKPNASQPTVVSFHVWVLSLDSIDEGSMTYAADIFMSQSWRDSRIQIPKEVVNFTTEYRLLPLSWLNRMWRPDSFFKNAKQVIFQEMTIPNHYIWLYPDQKILYMVKLTLLLSCAMKFQSYPHDTQYCSMQIESLSYTTDDLVFAWEEENALIVGEGIELPQHNLVSAVTGECHQVYSSGNFTCVQVTFTLKRRLGYFIFHTYVPTCLIVVMSWISFWIKPDAVPARVTLCVTSLLTLSTQHAQSQKSLPPVSYIKAIDIFMSSCTVFVFASLMEYALVNILMTSDEKRDLHQQHALALNTATGHTVLLTSSASASSQHHHQLHQLTHHHQLHHQHTGLHSAANAIVANVNSMNTTSTANTSRYTGAATTVELSSSNPANTSTTTHLRRSDTTGSTSNVAIGTSSVAIEASNVDRSTTGTSGSERVGTGGSGLTNTNGSFGGRNANNNNSNSNNNSTGSATGATNNNNNNSSNNNSNNNNNNNNNNNGQQNSPNSPSGQRFYIKRRDRALFVDKLSRWIFPSSFVILNAVYWTYYLNDPDLK